MIQESQSGNRLVGFYRGIVLQHLTHGYCKIWIPGVHPDEWKDDLKYIPAAEQAASLFGGAANGNGEFTYPNIGSIVWCFFANEDQNFPVYFASSLGGNNAFGQHEIIKPIDENVSKQHLLTSGKSHIHIHEKGKMTLQVEDPDRRDAEVEYGNTYNSNLLSSHVTSRPTCEQVDAQKIDNVHCRLDFDNSENDGQILASTHKFLSSGIEINSYGCFNAIDNIILSTDCKTPSKDAVTKLVMNSTDNVGMHNETIDYTNKCRITIDKTAKNGKISLMISDLDNPSESFSRIYLDKKGNVFIESSSSIVLKTKTMSIQSENQLDIKATSLKTTTKVDTSIVSPAINLDSSTGHTTIKSNTGVKSF